MLQQTRVETVIPYYRRFLARFPDVSTLAEANEAEVLALWSGLGYYRRCRALMAAARTIVALGGKLPQSARELERLPGIGPYTAAAIASIAFFEVVPVLDGNVERVLSRYSARPQGARKRSDREALLVLAAELLDRERPGDSNQALMELGATVCTPRAPRCPACPLARGCRALALGEPESYPAPAKRPPVERVHQLVVVVEVEDRLLLFRRGAAAGQLASLWEFPALELGGFGVSGVPGESAVSAGSPGSAGSKGVDGARGVEAALAARFGGSWLLGEELARLRHSITTRSFAIEVRRASFAVAAGAVAESSATEGEPGWWSRSELSGLALTGVARKVVARAGLQPD